LKSSKSLRVGKKLIIWPSHKHARTTIYNLHYKVRRGDSLGAIAHHYHVSVANLKKLNSLKTNNIRIGKVLLIKRVTRYTQHKITKRRSLKRIIYHVRAGDTLSAIAAHNKVTIPALKRWNKIDNSAHLKIHQELVIYKV